MQLRQLLIPLIWVSAAAVTSAQANTLKHSENSSLILSTTIISSSLYTSLPATNPHRASLPVNKQSPLSNLFKQRKAPKVSYRAELVYDAVKGEDITGGKINIRLPLN